MGLPLSSARTPTACQLALQDLAHITDELLPLHPAGAQLGLGGAVGFRVQLGEGQVFELRLELPDAQAVGERRIDVEGLPADPPPPLLGVSLDGAHVVQAVGQLDEDDPDVLRHRHQHLADVLGLGLLAAGDVDPPQLGDALDQAGHLVAEIAADVVQGDLGVLDGVVEDGRLQGLGVQAELAEQDRRRQGVLDIGLPGEPELPPVSPLRHLVGAKKLSTIGV